MGRSVNGFAAGGGAAGVQPYKPTRLYGAPCTGGDTGISAAGMIVSPFMVRPGQHILTGMWMATSSNAGNVRMGLWADDGSGRPGALIKDCGVVAATASAIVKATFSPIPIDAGPNGIMLQMGVVSAAATAIQAYSYLRDEDNVVGDPLADIGLDGAVPLTFYAATTGLAIRSGLFSATPVPATALASNPVLTSPAATGLVIGGLIFG